jgi:hypothetical protein
MEVSGNPVQGQSSLSSSPSENKLRYINLFVWLSLALR